MCIVSMGKQNGNDKRADIIDELFYYTISYQTSYSLNLAADSKKQLYHRGNMSIKRCRV